MSSLYSIARESYSNDPVTKPLRYYQIYDQVLREEELAPKTILEIGSYEGESTKALARCFPDARIMALDLQLRDIDFSSYRNITYLQCDQTDAAKLKAICEAHFPDGLDLVVEDASHIGHYSKITFDAVFPFVRSGGLYIVEDWGTGYWTSWIDGGLFSEAKLSPNAGQIRKKMVSHQLGMVGFIKSLVDYTAVDDIISPRGTAPGWLSRLALAAGRVRRLQKLADRMPTVKRYVLQRVTGDTCGKAQGSPIPSSKLPRIESLKIFRGVCVARKA